MVEGLTGLGSGFPTEDVIKQLMEAEREPLTKLEEEKSELEKTQEAWREVNSKLSGLDEAVSSMNSEDTFLSKTVDSSNEEVATASAESSASTGTYELDVANLAQSHRVVSEKQDSTSEPLGYGADGDTSEFTVTVDGTEETVTVEDDYSLAEVRDAINDDSENAEASIIDNQLVVESAETGEVNELQLEDTSGSVLEDLGITDGAGNIMESQVLQEAEDAELNINGLDVTRSSNTIDDVVEDVTFELSGEGQSVIDIEEDVGKTEETVQEFVDQYNEVQGFIDEKVNYDPESDESGALQGDTALSRLQSSLRSIATDSVDTESDYDQLAMVGIEIDRYGAMSFDSARFQEALEDDPEAVKGLFQANSEEGDDFDGVATRLEDYTYDVVQSADGVVPGKLDLYDNRIQNVEDDIVDFEEKLEDTRERYLQEFTAMEEAISGMKAQGDWMQSQLSGMGGSSNIMSSLM
ncbi:MAG: flagellar filament capping protein FliD [Bacillota bacterium]